MNSNITVIIPTSPIKKHPSITMIQAIIGLIRYQLPECKILITCDGIRPEQKNLESQYRLYKTRLFDWVRNQNNIKISFFDEHLHQTGMIKKVLPSVETEFILYIEHDFPVVGDIPWGAITRILKNKRVDLVRFYLETDLIPEHKHLLSEPTIIGGLPLIKTGQWSQRPHIARTSFYKRIAKLMPEKTYIEDGIHGYFGERFDGNPKDAWERNKLTIYYPQGDISRCIHLDGRQDSEKYI